MPLGTAARTSVWDIMEQGLEDWKKGVDGAQDPNGSYIVPETGGPRISRGGRIKEERALTAVPYESYCNTVLRLRASRFSLFRASS